ncbi:Dehydroquinase [Cenococcum geophilum 1.58]|uniref:Dehydroquinase n=1 Tax=Cenococcum geophilum 1.58 TaxID=794803 RepID=UPI00358FD034|nr:Dehydroquinase [Cenococcum geophilum 1.58]
MAKSILLINGVNLNLLGTREPHLYGSTTLLQVVEQAKQQAGSLSIQLEDIQSNHEGERSMLLLSTQGLSHTSVALRDALLGVDVPFIEVHVTNIHKRETFRNHSYLSDKAEAVVCGLGVYGYTAAIEYAAKHLKPKSKAQL